MGDRRALREGEIRWPGRWASEWPGWDDGWASAGIWARRTGGKATYGAVKGIGWATEFLVEGDGEYQGGERKTQREVKFVDHADGPLRGLDGIMAWPSRRFWRGGHSDMSLRRL